MVVIILANVRKRCHVISQPWSPHPSPSAYQWPPPSTREDGRQETAKRHDIRDKLYISSLSPARPHPGLVTSAGVHTPTRPFTVADPERHNMLRSCSRTGAWRHQVVKHSLAEAGCHGNPTGVCAMTTAQKKESVELPVNTEPAEEEVMAAGQDKWTAPELWPFCPTPRPASNDQRQCLKGREGCLHSRLRQCIRYVTNRQRMKRKSEMPVKSEDVSSRMYIVTRAASSSSSPMQVDPSDLYKAFMDTIARQTHLDSTAVHRPFYRHKSQRLACQTIDIT
ncbi:hypothetical protein C0Q70_11951 [Pomacea canaliculata]|uniref:Uncharacterized protein n=1 Tax=Pomacea canaliculata TaxID=400727 RepID=A0A2T7P7H6_POMCA|nr:hypothetical protein C0Q70_11951 [Pomacea canaliculata]